MFLIKAAQQVQITKDIIPLLCLLKLVYDLSLFKNDLNEQLAIFYSKKSKEELEIKLLEKERLSKKNFKLTLDISELINSMENTRVEILLLVSASSN